MALMGLMGLTALMALALCGCTHNPLRPAGQTSSLGLAPPPGVGAPAGVLAPATVSPLPSYADADPRQFETQLARSRQETQLAQDELSAVREQLASTSAQLAQSRATARPPAPGAVPTSGQPWEGAVAARPVAPATPGPEAMQEAMRQLSLPGTTARLDGGVVRIEIPADKLFEPGAAGLLPAGAAILSQSATEIERVFPGHFVGIEGHTDTEPVPNATWGSPHQLSVARATAVFDFFTSRTKLKPGQLFVVAHGPNHPVVSNATVAGRARNRRVELVVYPEQTADEVRGGTEQPAG